MEMFELQEQIENASNKDELQSMLTHITKDYESLQIAFGKFISAKNEPEAINAAMKMRYYNKVRLVM